MRGCLTPLQPAHTLIPAAAAAAAGHRVPEQLLGTPAGRQQPQAQPLGHARCCGGRGPRPPRLMHGNYGSPNPQAEKNKAWDTYIAALLSGALSSMIRYAMQGMYRQRARHLTAAVIKKKGAALPTRALQVQSGDRQRGLLLDGQVVRRKRLFRTLSQRRRLLRVKHQLPCLGGCGLSSRVGERHVLQALQLAEE